MIVQKSYLKICLTIEISLFRDIQNDISRQHGEGAFNKYLTVKGWVGILQFRDRALRKIRGCGRLENDPLRKAIYFMVNSITQGWGCSVLFSKVLLG